MPFRFGLPSARRAGRAAWPVTGVGRPEAGGDDDRGHQRNRDISHGSRNGHAPSNSPQMLTFGDNSVKAPPSTDA